MKIEVYEGDKVKVTPESEFEDLVWNKIKAEKQTMEAEIDSLRRSVKIIQDDNKFLLKIISTLKQYLSFKAIDNTKKKHDLRQELKRMVDGLDG